MLMSFVIIADMNFIRYFLTLSFFYIAQMSGSFLENHESEQVKAQIIGILNSAEITDFHFSRKVETIIFPLNVSKDEAIVIQDVLNLTGELPFAFQHIMQGAHVQIRDNGFLYFKWQEL